MKNFLSRKICLILVIIQKIQGFLMRLIKKLLAKIKYEFGGVIVNEAAGLKSKMYSMKNINGKEFNTAKGLSIATEFDKFKDVLFNKTLLDTK